LSPDPAAGRLSKRFGMRNKSKTVSTKGSDSRIPEHVFISFSQKDKEVAESIVYGLRESDIPVWIDS
jgi:hypothetical protein